MFRRETLTDEEQAALDEQRKRHREAKAKRRADEAAARKQRRLELMQARRARYSPRLTDSENRERKRLGAVVMARVRREQCRKPKFVKPGKLRRRLAARARKVSP